MRYIAGKRRRRFCAPRTRKRKRWKLLLGILAAAAILFGFFAEKGLSSVSEELTQEAAKGYLTKTVNQAVNNNLKKVEGSFTEIQREGGEISAIYTDPEALNQLKTALLTELTEELNGSAELSVPVGSLTDISLLNGRGFPVPIRLNFEGTADVAFHTEFLSAGINQTCHRVTMVVHAQVFSQSRRFETYADTESATVLSETVIVGETPKVSAAFRA